MQILKKIYFASVLVLTCISVSIASTSIDAKTLMPVSNVKDSKFDKELFSKEQFPQMYCLAENIYHESRPDNLAGMAAVADVVLNRVSDARYPNTICEVIQQGPVRESWKTKNDPNLPVEQREFYPIRHKCQFSWYCDGQPDIIYNNDAWRKSQEVAYYMLKQKKWIGLSEGATHYHATYVSPEWSKKFILIGRIGLHIFYRQR